MTQQYIPSQDDEIDLFELVQTLWGYKWLIAGITALATALGVVFALSITPIFEAEAQLVAPRANDVREFQVGVSEIEYSPGQVYSRFQSNLESITVRRLFFDEFIDPVIARNPEHTDFTHFNESFNELLKVDVGTITTVAIESTEPEQAAQWVNDWVDFVASYTVNELVEEANQFIETSLRRIDQQLNSRREVIELRRLDRIIRLEEALVIARAMNIQDPMIESAANQLNMEYMRGARALAAEIDMLRSRESDEPFIADIRNLQERAVLLQNIDLNSSLIRVMRIDQAAEVPTSRKSPNRSLIAAVSLVLGGMIGLFAALILGALRKRQQAAG